MNAKGTECARAVRPQDMCRETMIDACHTDT